MGRKKVEDPKVHLPNVTVNKSVIDQMVEVLKEHPEFVLSVHYQQALENYIDKMIPSKRLIRLGPTQK
jgi:hypothetical protein